MSDECHDWRPSTDRAGYRECATCCVTGLIPFAEGGYITDDPDRRIVLDRGYIVTTPEAAEKYGDLLRAINGTPDATIYTVDSARYELHELLATEAKALPDASPEHATEAKAQECYDSVNHEGEEV